MNCGLNPLIAKRRYGTSTAQAGVGSPPWRSDYQVHRNRAACHLAVRNYPRGVSCDTLRAARTIARGFFFPPAAVPAQGQSTRTSRNDCSRGARRCREPRMIPAILFRGEGWNEEDQLGDLGYIVV